MEKQLLLFRLDLVTAQSGIDKSIREYLVEKKMLGGVVSMPSNISQQQEQMFRYFL